MAMPQIPPPLLLWAFTMYPWLYANAFFMFFCYRYLTLLLCLWRSVMKLICAVISTEWITWKHHKSLSRTENQHFLCSDSDNLFCTVVNKPLFNFRSQYFLALHCVWFSASLAVYLFHRQLYQSTFLIIFAHCLLSSCNFCFNHKY